MAWFTHTIIILVLLFSSPWRWSHEWPKHVGDHYVIKLHPQNQSALVGLLISRITEYVVSTNLNILNKDNEPAFVITNRKEVIDLTLETDKKGDLVINWHVPDKISLSDHRYIIFQVSDMEVTRLTYCNSKTANLESYCEDLKANLRVVSWAIHSVQDV